MKRFEDIDYRLSKKFWLLIDHESKIRLFLRILTQTGTTINWTIIMGIIYFLHPHFKEEAFTIIFMNIFVMGIVFVIKHTVKRPRPHLNDSKMGNVAFDEWSFPSGHATRSTFLVFLMSLYFPKTISLWVLWGILIILTRLLLGLHYLTDLIFGIIISLIILLILFSLNWLPIIPLYQYVPF